MKLNFDVLPVKYWDVKTKMSWLQRRVIIYSIMYYELNESCISDKDFDELSHQLVELMNSTDISECEKSTYWYCMYDFDGSTGFHLYGRLNKSDKVYLKQIAGLVLKQFRGTGAKKRKMEANEL